MLLTREISVLTSRSDCWNLLGCTVGMKLLFWFTKHFTFSYMYYLKLDSNVEVKHLTRLGAWIEPTWTDRRLVTWRPLLRYFRTVDSYSLCFSIIDCECPVASIIVTDFQGKYATWCDAHLFWFQSTARVPTLIHPISLGQHDMKSSKK